MSLSPLDWHIRFIQQAAWTRQLREYLIPRAGLEGSSLVLDVGCGTGVLEAEFKPSKSFHVHALDINFEFLRMTKNHAPACIAIQADGHALPYENRQFDIVFCHYLLLWVFDAVKVVQEMARVTRIGGMVTALAEPDYGGRIDYPPPFHELGELQVKALRSQGADISMGRKLGEVFSKAGLENIEIGVLGGQWLQGLSLSEIDSEWKVLQHDLESYKQHNITDDCLKDLYQLDISSWNKRERILFIPTFYACGQVPKNEEVVSNRV
ncbi:MAG: class I SAM-dependent methyltransferase [Anaerolineales bacterium]|nr:class I SAM-dependent methyltransferase [Anaerolineales bacterium]